MVTIMRSLKRGKLGEASDMRWIRSILSVILLLFSGSLAGAQTASPTPTPQVAQPNSWWRITPRSGAMPRYYSSAWTDCTQQVALPQPVNRGGFNGICLGGEQIFYFGGGHSSSAANEVEIFDIANETWTQRYAPECLPACCRKCSITGVPCISSGSPAPQCTQSGETCNTTTCSSGVCGPTVGCACAIMGGGGTDEISPLGRPYAEHTYQHKVYHPARSTLFFSARAGTMEYNSQTETWTRRVVSKRFQSTGGQPIYDFSSNQVLTYDPPSGKLMIINHLDYPGVWTLDEATWSWSVLPGSMPTELTSLESEIFSAYDEGRQKHLVSIIGQGTGLWWYDSVAHTWTAVANRPTTIKDSRGRWPSSFAYDSTNAVMLIAGANSATNSVDLWTLDPSDNWTRLTPNGQPGGADNITARWNQLWYSPLRKQFYYLFINGAGGGGQGGIGPNDTQLWAFNLGVLGPTNTPGPATATPTIAPPLGACTWFVGPTRTYKLPSAVAGLVQNGDVVCIDSGAYVRDVAVWTTNNLTLRGVGGMARLDAGGTAALSKGIWVLQGNNTRIENVEFFCATSRGTCVGGSSNGKFCIDSSMCPGGGTCTGASPECSGGPIGDQNDAGIRIDGTARDVTIQNCSFHDNDNGILGGNSICSNVNRVCTQNQPCPTPGICQKAGTLTITNSKFFRNGTGDGQSHNAYLSAGTLIFQGNYSHQARIGHELKTRADTNYILYNRLMSEAAGTGSVLAEIPNGGLTYVIGNVMEKGPVADANEFVKYGAEIGGSSGPNPIQELYVINNTMVSDLAATVSYVHGYGTPLIWFKNNIAFGSGSLILWSGGPGTFVQSNNLTTNPSLVNRAAYDYRLATGSAAINAAADPGAVRGFALTPAMQYVYDLQGQVRSLSGALDIGAFEYSGSETPLPTPTRTTAPTAGPTPQRPSPPTLL